MNRITLLSQYKSKIIQYIGIGIVIITLTFAFYFSSIATGDDWQTFYDTLGRILQKENLYNKPTSFAYYSNPPWPLGSRFS